LNNRLNSLMEDKRREDARMVPVMAVVISYGENLCLHRRQPKMS